MTLFDMALKTVSLQLAYAIGSYHDTRYGALYLTTTSPDLWDVSLRGTFLPPVSGDTGCLKFHAHTDTALPAHIANRIMHDLSGLPASALAHAQLHACTLCAQRLRRRPAA